MFIRLGYSKMVNSKANRTNMTIVKKRDLIMKIPTCLSIERRSVNILIYHRVVEGTIGVVRTVMMIIPSIWTI